MAVPSSRHTSARARGRRRRALRCAGVVALVFASAPALAPGVRAQGPGPDGSDVRRLTVRPAEDRDPAWSPDGRWVYFSSDRGGSFDILRIAAAGGGPEAVITGSGHDRFPAVSPDGARIAYQSGDPADPGLWLAGAEGEAPRLLLRDPAAELTADWAPDGARIAITSDRAGNADLWLVGVADGELTRLTDHRHRDAWPRWSPDGAHIVFFSRRDTDEQWDDLYVLRTSDGDIRRLTDNGALHDFTPSWSSDGRFVLTAISDAVADRALVVYDSSGNEVLRFAEGFHRVFQPAWSPDGARIVASVREREGEAADLVLFEVPERLRPSRR